MSFFFSWLVFFFFRQQPRKKGNKNKKKTHLQVGDEPLQEGSVGVQDEHGDLADVPSDERVLKGAFGRFERREEGCLRNGKRAPNVGKGENARRAKRRQRRADFSSSLNRKNSRTGAGGSPEAFQFFSPISVQQRDAIMTAIGREEGSGGVLEPEAGV